VTFVVFLTLALQINKPFCASFITATFVPSHLEVVLTQIEGIKDPNIYLIKTNTVSGAYFIAKGQPEDGMLEKLQRLQTQEEFFMHLLYLYCNSLICSLSRVVRILDDRNKFLLQIWQGVTRELCRPLKTDPARHCQKPVFIVEKSCC